MSCELQVGVAVGVLLAVATGAVELEAVELHSEVVLWPEGVDFVGRLLSFNYCIEGWARYVGGGLYQCLEAALELAFLGAWLVGGDRSS